MKNVSTKIFRYGIFTIYPAELNNRSCSKIYVNSDHLICYSIEVKRIFFRLTDITLIKIIKILQ